MLNWRLENAVPAPLPGNPTLIAQFADRYSRMSEALNQAVEELNNLANEGVSISLAVDEVRDRARDSIDTTRKVAVRYEGAAQTLSSYQDALGDAISSAASARNTINSNNPSAGYWRRRERDLELQRLLDPTNNDLIEDIKEANRWVTEYDNEYLTAIQTYNTAVQTRDNAVNSAIAGLNNAAEQAGLNDDFWERIEGGLDALYDLAQKYLAPLIEMYRELLEFLKQIVDILCLIVSILAIFIPVLAPFAALLTVISLAMSAMILICSLLLFALGKETLGRVLGDIIDLAVGLVTSKLGPLKNLGASSSLIKETGGQVLATQGTIVLKFMFGAGTEVAAGVGIELLKEAGSTVAVDFASNLAESFANESFTNTMGDWPQGGQPWGGDNGGLEFEPGNFTWDHVGEAGADALTGGALMPFVDGFQNNFTNIAKSNADLATNLGQFGAVPAG